MSAFTEKEIMDDIAEELVRILPQRILSRGVDSDAFSPNGRSVG